jgi:starch synthase
MSEKSILNRVVAIAPKKIKNAISNRIIANIPQSKLVTYPITEFKFVKKSKQATNKEKIWFERNRLFQERVSAEIISASDAVIGFDTSSWILSERTKLLHKKFILDVSIAHSVSKNNVYTAIAKQYPEWSFALEQKSDVLLKVEQDEYQSADAIVVASSFTRNTLIENGIPIDKIFINPYGIDTTQFKLKTNFYKGGPVKFLFVGLVDARKGVPLLMDIIQQVDPGKASFTFVGPIEDKVTQLFSKQNFPNVHLAGKVPHKNLVSIFEEHDVFVFPSYFEGFGLVILEAMATGLPVITTVATAGPDCIDNGEEGFVIQCGDKDALKTSVEYFMQQPNEIERMGTAARKKAEQFSWNAYGDRYEEIINTVCSNSN